MKPEVDQILVQSLGTLMGDVAPHLTQDYAQGHVGAIGMLMIFAAQEYERGAEIRVAENKGMRALFGDAAEVITDDKLICRLNAAARGQDTCFAITALNAENDRLKTLLIELHEYVEGWGHPQAEEVDAKIWSLLRSFADNRALHLPEM